MTIEPEPYASSGSSDRIEDRATSEENPHLGPPGGAGEPASPRSLLIVLVALILCCALPFLLAIGAVLATAVSVKNLGSGLGNLTLGVAVALVIALVLWKLKGRRGNPRIVLTSSGARPPEAK